MASDILARLEEKGGSEEEEQALKEASATAFAGEMSPVREHRKRRHDK